ncbi:MAG TPA: hypothetical protein VJT69_00455 [Pyrinomonadaceae bacterium]|nr:hypothetical protein [Pyrinomonadaceae bacterium]
MSKYLLIALPLVFFSVSPVFAQGGGPPPVNKVNAERMRQQEMSRREYDLRNFGNESGAPKDKRQVEALMAQTEEDFNRILSLHNEIARALTSKDDLNYQFVSDATAEINKRASRVQHSLALGLSSEEARELKKSKDEPIKDSLIKLCNEIRSFVTNPSIENPNTINVDQMKKARRDLESLIELSGRIKKEADKLRR